MFDIEKIPDINRPFAEQNYTDDGHFYKTKNGDVYPSITTIFKRVEPFDKSTGYEHFITWAMNKNNLGRSDAIEWCKEYSRQSTNVGTELHKLIESYMQNIIPEENEYHIKPNIYTKNPYELFTVMKPWLDEHISTVYGTEFKLYSDELKIAGTVDLVAKVDGEICIVDFKNSRKPKSHKKCEENHYFEQMTAYAKMWEFCTGQKIETGIILVASWDNKVKPFKVKLADYESKMWDWIIRYETLI